MPSIKLPTHWKRSFSMPHKKKKRHLDDSTSPNNPAGQVRQRPESGDMSHGQRLSSSKPSLAEDSNGSQEATSPSRSSGPAVEEPVNYTFLTSHIVASELDNMPINEDTCQKLLDDIKLLIADERLLVAERLWDKLEQWLDKSYGENSRLVKRELARPKMVKLLKDLRDKVEICHQAFRDLGSDDNWRFAQEYWGITTHYRTKDDGSLTVRLQGELSGCSVFDQLSVLREADMFHTWGPFINKSLIVKEAGKCSMVMYFNIFVPLIANRDALVHVFACDHTEEGIILVCGESVGTPGSGECVTDRLLPHDLPIPPLPAAFNAGRMTVSDFRCQVRLTSPTTCFVQIIATMQPHLPLPQSLINLGTRKLAGVFLYYLQQQAKKVQQDPVHNAHAQRMREHPFYSDYFIPRVVSFSRAMGWPIVSTPAFEVPGDTSRASILWQQAKAGGDPCTPHAVPCAVPRSPPALSAFPSYCPPPLPPAPPSLLSLASSYLTWSVLAGLLHLVPPTLLPLPFSACDALGFVLLRLVHLLQRGRYPCLLQHLAGVGKEVCVALLLAACVATWRCFHCPPLAFSDGASVSLALLRRLDGPPLAWDEALWATLKWWDMLAAPAVALMLGARLGV